LTINEVLFTAFSVDFHNKIGIKSEIIGIYFFDFKRGCHGLLASSLNTPLNIFYCVIYRVGQKSGCFALKSIASQNIDRFSKFFHCQMQNEH